MLKILLLSVLAVAMIGLMVPSAFADHMSTTIQPIAGSGTAIGSGGYSPNSVTVDVGSDIIFVNTDSVPHTFTSGSPSDGPGVWDCGIVEPGGNCYVTTELSDAGTTDPFFCLLHPWMTGVIYTLDVSSPPPTAPEPVRFDLYVQSSAASGDSVSISGIATGKSSGTPITIAVFSPNGNVVDATQLLPNNDGSFQIYIVDTDVAPYSQTGYYEVQATYGSHEIFERFYFTVSAPEPEPEPELDLQVARSSYQSGDIISISGYAFGDPINDQIGIFIYNPNGTLVKVEQFSVSGTGGFSKQITTVSSLWNISGNYEVQAIYGSLKEVERFYFYAPINDPPPQPTPTPPPSSTPVKPTLTLYQIPSAVRAGDTVTFTGKLTSQGQPVSGEIIYIYENDPFKIDQKIGSGRTNSNGEFSISWKVTAGLVEIDFDIYACHEPTAIRCGVQTPDQEMRVTKYWTGISLDYFPQSVRVGENIIFSGQVKLEKGSPEGFVVYIKDEDTFNSDDLMATAYVNSDGTFTANWIASQIDANDEIEVYAVLEATDSYYRSSTCADSGITLDFGGDCSNVYPMEIIGSIGPETEIIYEESTSAYNFSGDEYLNLYYAFDFNKPPVVAIVADPDAYEQVRSYLIPTQEGILAWTDLLEKKYPAGNWDVEFFIKTPGKIFEKKPDVIVNVVYYDDGCGIEYGGYANLSGIKPVNTLVCTKGQSDRMYNPSSVGSTAGHEFFHAIGLGHTFNKIGDRMCSVEGGKATCPIGGFKDVVNSIRFNSDKPSDFVLSGIVSLYGEDGWSNPNNDSIFFDAKLTAEEFLSGQIDKGIGTSENTVDGNMVKRIHAYYYSSESKINVNGDLADCGSNYGDTVLIKIFNPSGKQVLSKQSQHAEWCHFSIDIPVNPYDLVAGDWVASAEYFGEWQQTPFNISSFQIPTPEVTPEEYIPEVTPEEYIPEVTPEETSNPFIESSMIQKIPISKFKLKDDQFPQKKYDDIVHYTLSTEHNLPSSQLDVKSRLMQIFDGAYVGFADNKSQVTFKIKYTEFNSKNSAFKHYGYILLSGQKSFKFSDEWMKNNLPENSDCKVVDNPQGNNFGVKGVCYIENYVVEFSSSMRDDVVLPSQEAEKIIEMLIKTRNSMMADETPQFEMNLPSEEKQYLNEEYLDVKNRQDLMKKWNNIIFKLLPSFNLDERLEIIQGKHQKISDTGYFLPGNNNLVVYLQDGDKPPITALEIAVADAYASIDLVETEKLIVKEKLNHMMSPYNPDTLEHMVYLEELISRANGDMYSLENEIEEIEKSSEYNEYLNESANTDTQEQSISSTDSELSSEGGGCLIATAAFGSEMAPQVQFLRELRDNTVMSTESGTAFMTGFNQFYYSFSPQIADYERENPIFKEAVKVTLTPLLTSLTLLNYVDVDTEEEMLGYGIGIILLNIGMYFVAPAVLIITLKKFFNSIEIK